MSRPRILILIDALFSSRLSRYTLTTPQNVIALLSNGRGEFTPLPAGGASVTAYRERIAQMQRELDAQRAAGQAVVFTTNTYENF